MPSSPRPHDHIATLDLLRLVAALAVVGFHYLYRGAVGDPVLSHPYPEAAPFAIYGYLGVNLFFLISGFVIAWSAEGRDWASFAVARFARLYPGFLACMTITFLVMLGAASPHFPVSVAQYGANLFMLAPAFGQDFMDGAYWSIVLEVVFYGWVALALACRVFDRLRLELVAGWLVICALNEFVLHNGGLRLVLVTEFGPLFAAGVLIQYMYAHGRSPTALLLLLAAFALSSTNMTVAQTWMHAHYGQSIPLVKLVAVNLGIHALLVGAIMMRRMLRPGPLVLALGGITYPLYLLHQHIGYVAIEALAPGLGRWTAAAVVTVAIGVVACAIWRYVERPARRSVVAKLGPLLAAALAKGSARLGPTHQRQRG
jgi:peptidoglycan/LPS O-acetylase OafA/YrhL